MLPVKQIIFIHDFSRESKQALLKSCDIAVKTGSKLFVYRALPETVSDEEMKKQLALLRRGVGYLRKKFSYHGLQIAFEIEKGDQFYLTCMQIKNRMPWMAITYNKAQTDQPVCNAIYTNSLPFLFIPYNFKGVRFPMILFKNDSVIHVPKMSHFLHCARILLKSYSDSSLSTYIMDGKSEHSSDRLHFVSFLKRSLFACKNDVEYISDITQEQLAILFSSINKNRNVIAIGINEYSKLINSTYFSISGPNIKIPFLIL